MVQSDVELALHQSESMASNHDSQESYTSIADADFLALETEPVEQYQYQSQSTATDESIQPSQLGPSSELAPEDIIDYNTPRVRREMVRDACAVSPEYARSILARYERDATLQGWCRVVGLRESKENGYVQVSWAGANKFAVLQEVVIWANGETVRAGEDASHLCHQKKCIHSSHIIPESTVANQARKGCRVWVGCSHCSKKVFVCFHQPPCIKYCPGFRDHLHFLAEGICKDAREEPPVGI